MAKVNCISDKRPPDKNPREQSRENLYNGFLSGFFVLGLLKIGGSEMCDVLSGGPGMCDSVTGGGVVKIGQKYRDVLYGRPHRPTISSRFPLFHYLFFTSLLFFRFRLFHLLFVTQLYYFFKVFTVP